MVKFFVIAVFLIIFIFLVIPLFKRYREKEIETLHEEKTNLSSIPSKTNVEKPISHEPTINSWKPTPVTKPIPFGPVLPIVEKKDYSAPVYDKPSRKFLEDDLNEQNHAYSQKSHSVSDLDPIYMTGKIEEPKDSPIKRRKRNKSKNSIFEF